MQLTTTELLIGLGIAIAAILVFIKIFSKPMKLIFKLLINAATGFVMLFIVNFFADILGVHLEYNLINAIVVGALGLPGVVILFVIQFAL